MKEGEIRDIRIHRLNVELSGVDARAASETARLLGTAIGRQVGRTTPEDARVGKGAPLDRGASPAHLSERVALRVAAEIRAQSERAQGRR